VEKDRRLRLRWRRRGARGGAGIGGEGIPEAATEREPEPGIEEARRGRQVWRRTMTGIGGGGGGRCAGGSEGRQEAERAAEAEVEADGSRTGCGGGGGCAGGSGGG
jgi:hypothetical protein